MRCPLLRCLRRDDDEIDSIFQIEPRTQHSINRGARTHGAARSNRRQNRSIRSVNTLGRVFIVSMHFQLYFASRALMSDDHHTEEAFARAGVSGRQCRSELTESTSQSKHGVAAASSQPIDPSIRWLSHVWMVLCASVVRVPESATAHSSGAAPSSSYGATWRRKRVAERAAAVSSLLLPACRLFLALTRPFPTTTCKGRQPTQTLRYCSYHRRHLNAHSMASTDHPFQPVQARQSPWPMVPSKSEPPSHGLMGVSQPIDEKRDGMVGGGGLGFSIWYKSPDAADRCRAAAGQPDAAVKAPRPPAPGMVPTTTRCRSTTTHHRSD